MGAAKQLKGEVELGEQLEANRMGVTLTVGQLHSLMESAAFAGARAALAANTAVRLDDIYLTAEQIAAALQDVVPKTVHNWARESEDNPNPLPCVEIGRERRFRREDVIAWLRARNKPTQHVERLQKLR